MRFLQRHKTSLLSIGIIFILNFFVTDVHAQWYISYREGLRAMEQRDWNKALRLLQEAVKIQSKDTKKIRTRGTIFIEYYPNREIGVCYYHLGDATRAKQALSLSLSQTFTTRAKTFLDRINRGDIPSGAKPPPPERTPPPETKIEPPPETKQPPVEEPVEEPSSPLLVGERLSIAIMPFESTSSSGRVGQLELLDKIITGFKNIERFKIFERAEIQTVLDEQVLGMSGVLDNSTAAKIGKGIGVDAVLLGRIQQDQNSVGIDARLIDTETIEILSSRDAFSSGSSLQNLSAMITQVAEKIKSDLPIVSGYVIGVSSNKITIDLGYDKGIKKGTKCHVYREGAPIIHPVSGEIIGKKIDMICEIQASEIFNTYATAVITKTTSGIPSIRDRVITK